jgi:hypothetical protein
MDMRILRLVHGQIVPLVADTEARQLDQLFQLLRCTGDLQSEPGATASELLARLQVFDELTESLLKLHRNIQSGRRLAVEDWLSLTYLATLKFLLRDRWDDCYMIIFDAYPALGEGIKRVLAFIEDIPFAAGTALLEKDWDDNSKEPGFEMVALTYVRACGLIGVFGSSRFYERVSECLTYEKEFLVLLLAAACFKVPAIASQVDIGTWTDTQYACMSLLDNFVHLGETAWG